MTKEPINDLLKVALFYADHGWPVLPLHTPTASACTCSQRVNCQSPGKHPRWHAADLRYGVRSATCDFPTVSRWWKRWPTANIGIATGKTSFDVLDVDIKEGTDGSETLDDLEAQYGKLPHTLEQITGSGGRHILFRHHDGIRNAARFAPGLDLRTDGGYIVAPPSLHSNGRRYEWEMSSMPGEVPLAPWPSWLLNIIQRSSRADLPPCPNPAGWQHEILRGVHKGCRDQSATRLAGFYLQRGLTPEEVFFLLSGWNAQNRPPLEDADIRRIVKSIARIHERNLAMATDPRRPDRLSRP